MEGYCIKCKKKTEIKDGQVVFYKNGTPAERGLCSVCGSKVARMLSKQEREALKAKQTTGEVK
jgi:hypothetical protein